MKDGTRRGAGGRGQGAGGSIQSTENSWAWNRGVEDFSIWNSKLLCLESKSLGLGTGGRHPLCECVVETFVPNDTVLDSNHQGEEVLPTLLVLFNTLEPRVERYKSL